MQFQLLEGLREEVCRPVHLRCFERQGNVKGVLRPVFRNRDVNRKGGESQVQRDG